MLFEEWRFDFDWEGFVVFCLGFVYVGFTTSRNGMDSVWSGSRLVFHNINIESLPPVAK